MKTLHFGIEMEMTGITREKAANLMAGFFGTGWGTHQGGVYDTWTATDDLGRTWKVMSDSSIHAPASMPREKWAAGLKAPLRNTARKW